MQTISKKYILFEIDRSVFLPNNNWVAIENNIKCITYSNEEKTTSFSYGFGAWGYFDYGSSGTGTLPAQLEQRKPILKVNSLGSDLGNFVQVESIEELRLLENTFYFDIDTQILYVNFPLSNPDPANYSFLALGATKGYANIAGTYGNLYYEARIRNAPSISISKDNQFFGIVTYDEGSITLNNTDGELDNFRDEDFFGAYVRVLTSTSTSYEDFNIIYSGYLDSFSLSTRDLTIGMRDIRKLLEASVQKTLFSTSVYPYLDTGLKDTLIPIAFGKILDAPATPLDSRDAQPNYTFKLADTSLYPIQSIGQVRVDGVKVAHSSANISSATFVLSSSVYSPGKKVTCDFNGYVKNGVLIENPLEIIEEMCSLISIPYNTFFFDTATWESVKNSGLPACNLLISSPTQAISIINSLSSSIFGLFLITPEGKFTYKIKDTSAPIKRVIEVSQLLTPPALDYVSSSYLSSVRVGYARRYSSSYSYFKNNTRETTLRDKYRVSKEVDFPTQLTNLADAEAYSETILDEFGGIYPEYTFDTKILEDIEILDILEVELYRFTDATYGKVKVIVNSISHDHNTGRASYRCRWLEDVTAHINLATFIKWTPSSSYLQGAVVSSEGQLWRAIVPSINNKPVPDSEFWTEFGMLLWQDYVDYPVNGIVAYNGVLYKSLTINVNKQPDISVLDWERLNSGGSTDWKTDLSYSIGDVVFYSNTFYRSTVNNNKGDIPSNLLNWERITDYSLDNLAVHEINFGTNSTVEWNETDATLDVSLKNGVTGQLFQETYLYCKALENISNGDIVQFSGSDGINIQIVKANVDIVSPTTGWYEPETTLGVATQDILTGQKGYITSFGRVRDIDTSAWTVGTELFLDPDIPGKLSNNYAEAGIKWVSVGIVEKQSATEGIIFVRPSWGDSIEDVTLDPTGFDIPANVIVTYNSAARTVTLTGSDWNAYWRGNKICCLESGWISDPHPIGITSTHYLYFDGELPIGSQFVWSSSPWTFNQLQIALVAADSTGIKFCQREPHGTMNWRTHEEFHQTIGTYLIGGGDLTNYTIDSTTLRSPQVSTTSIKDEDLITVNNPLTTASYTQAYLTGAGTMTFITGASTIVPVSGANPYWNEYNGSTWQQSLVLNNGYMSIWLVAIPVAADTGSQSYRYIWIQGQSSDGLDGQSTLGPSSVNLGNLTSLTPEIVFLDRIIIRYLGGNWSISDVTKLVGSKIFQSAVPGGSFLSSVASDATIDGVGTSTSPLTVVSAPKLTTARTIASKTFDGTQNVTLDTLTRGSYLTGSNYNGSTATTWAVDATTSNTGSKVVARDSSGNFIAGTITATLNGNAATASLATDSIEWDGAAKTISASDPIGGADGDIWIQTGAASGGAGTTEWKSDFSYSIGNVVYYSGSWYTSIADENEANIPSSTPASWTKITSFDITASAVPWSGITSKPTTNLGYAISDGVITSGNGLAAWTATNSNLTITLGTPSSITTSSTNSVTTTSHTHAITGFLPSASYTPTAAVLSGYVAATGTISATDTIETAIEKLGADKHVAVTIGTANGLSLSTQAISLATASTSVTGALTSTDWNTFNGKQAALVSGTNIKTVNSTTLLGSGNLAVGTVTSVAAGNGLTFTTITGTGSVTMGTPSTITTTSTNSVATDSHTHAITGHAQSATNTTSVLSRDSRATTILPQDYSRGIHFDFQANTTDGLSDGGTYNGLITYRQYGATTDWTGGLSHQIGQTDNGNLWHRTSSANTWGTWKKLIQDDGAGLITSTITNSIEWNGAAQTVSASAPTGGADGDIWIQTGVTAVSISPSFSGTWPIVVNVSNTALYSVPAVTITGSSGTIAATTFSGSGASLTSLNASNLSSGTVADARLTGIYSGFTHKIDGSNTIYSTPNTGSTSTVARTVSHLAEYKSAASAQIGALVFIQNNTTSSIMYKFDFEGMLYNNNLLKFSVQGYRTTTTWSATKKINLGTADVQVRLGVTPSGNNCIILGDVATSWSYPHITLVRAMMSHTGASDTVCSGWTVAVATSLATYTNVTATIANNNIVSNITGSSTSSTGNAATATKLATARSIALTSGVTGSANFDGSGNISITATVVNDSHTHDTRYFTETELATLTDTLTQSIVNQIGNQTGAFPGDVSILNPISGNVKTNT